MAPESYFDGLFDTKSDVYMFGVLMWGLSAAPALALTATEIFAFGTIPWVGYSDQEVILNIRENKMLNPPIGCPAVMYAIMKKFEARIVWL